MRRSLLTIGTAIGALMAPSIASAATTIVVAKDNSVLVTPGNPGTGASTGLFVGIGQIVSVSVDPTAIWASGAIPLWSTAAGQIGDLYSTAGDASGTTAGTLIGAATSPLTYAGLTAPVGSLVAGINGDFTLIGTGTSFVATQAGEVQLFFWDNFSGDNVGSLSVQATVPEPATWALMMAGFGILGFGLRRRTAATSRVSFKFA